MREDFVNDALCYLTKCGLKWKFYTTSVAGAEVAIQIFGKDIYLVYGYGSTPREAVSHLLDTLRKYILDAEQRSAEDAEEFNS